MQFNSFADFIAMGGHGLYVWLSYGVSAVLFFLLVYISKSQNKQVINQILQRQIRHEKLKKAEKNKQLRHTSSTLGDSSNLSGGNTPTEPITEKKNDPTP